MRRVLAAIRNEARLCVRQGICLAALLAAGMAGAVAMAFPAMPAEARAGLLPGTLLLLALVCGFGFGGYRMLRDRRDGILATLDVSPLRPLEALASRVLVLAALAVPAALLAALAVRGLRFQALPLAVGVGAGTALAALAGLVAAAWHRPGPGVAAWAPAYVLALAAPLLPGIVRGGTAAGVAAGFRWHPLHGPLTLLEGALIPSTRANPADAALGLGVTLLWAGAALVLCKRALGRLRERGGA